MSSPFETHTCSAPAERSARMRDIVLEHAPRDRAIHALDIGCGTGSLVFHLAAALPLASVIGIDISAANIQIADALRNADPASARVRFSRADYLHYEASHEGGPAVDLIVTDTVLHFIAAPPAHLWAKLARDVRAGGLLIACMA